MRVASEHRPDRREYKLVRVRALDPRLVLNLDWTPLAPVMVNLGVSKAWSPIPCPWSASPPAASPRPFLEARSKTAGAFRCRAEQIVRTVLNLPPLDRFTTLRNSLR